MSDSTPGAAAARLRRYARPAKWGAGVLVVVAVLGYGVVPPVARHYAVTGLTDLLGRKVEIEAVRFNPFTLTAQVRGMRILEADGEGEAFGVDLIRANLELESIVRGGPVLHELAVVTPRLHFVQQGQGQHNWSDVVARLAAAPKTEGEGGAGARFSVGNIALSGGRVLVEDLPRGLKHEVSELTLGVPFISNLPVKVDVFVEPTLSARLDGEPVAISGRLKPFVSSRDTVVDVSLKEFELAPWMPYLPFEPAFRLPQGTLGTDLQIAFSQPEGESPRIALKGQVQVNGLVIQDKAGAPAFKVGELGVELADVQPLIGRWHFSRLRIMQPELDLVRLADGGLNLTRLYVPAPAAGAAKAAAGKTGADAAPAAATASQPAGPDFLLASARIRDGVLRVEDRSFKTPFRFALQAINLDLRDLATTGDMPAEIRLDYASDGGEKFTHQDQLRLAPFSLEGGVSIENLQPGRYAPYLALGLPGGELRGGRVDGNVRYRVAGPDLTTEIASDELAVRDFVLGLKGRKDAVASVPELVVKGAEIKLAERAVRVESVATTRAALAATRLPNGEFDVMGLLGEPAAKKDDGAPWKVELQKLDIAEAAVRLEDRTVDKPVSLVADGIALVASNLSTAKGVVSAVDLKSRINEGGRIAAVGTVGLEPFKTDLKLDLSAVDLLPLQPYVLKETKIAISRGKLSTKGDLSLAVQRDGSLAGRFKGDVGVADFSSVDRLNSTSFVRWRQLQVDGIDAKLEPFALAIDRIGISSFHTRLILNEKGQLNLREIRGDEAPSEAAASGGGAEIEREPGRSTTEVPAPAPMPPIRIGRVDVRDGNVAFSDRFVRPNYDANLTGMVGTLRGLSSDPTTIAKLELNGKVDGSAPVSVTGELNPFRQDRYLDIVASVKDFELNGLSSYSGKYVGYGIEKGKLSADLNYRIEDRKLTATNRVFLDQLTFGDKVDSPDATSLPVQLAVSLLKNGRGEIDVNLPISGTLDDPQFSVFGLVMRALVNLLGKAVTSPFALLGAAFEGGESLSQVEFDAGRTSPSAAEFEKLGQLATALNERPALKLDVTPQVDPASDTEGLKQAKLERRLKLRKLRGQVAKNQEAPPVDEIELAPAEYAALLKQVYRDSEFEKPRNIIGLAKDLPVEEMERLIKANTEVTADDLRALGQQRGQAIKLWLTESGKVSPERIFLLAPKVGGSDQEGKRQALFSLR